MVDHRGPLATAVRKAQKKAERQYKDEHPEAAGLGVHSVVAAYRRRPKGANFAVRAVSLMLGSKFAKPLSNKAIVAQISKDYPGYSVPVSILTEKFSARETGEVAKLLGDLGKKIDLKICNSASKVKKAIFAKQSISFSKYDFNDMISITNDLVIVGLKSYPIQIAKNTRRIHVGKSWLNVEVLQAFLTGQHLLLPS